MNRLTLISILLLKVTQSEDRSERLSLALQATEKIQDEQTENYLRRYYQGL